MPEEPKSFWSTIPGIITAIATLITAIGGFLVVLNQVGVFGSKPEPKLELPVKRILQGAAPEAVASRDALALPAALDAFVAYAAARRGAGRNREAATRSAR